MKQVLEQYASAVITSMLAMLLLGMLSQNITGQGLGISQVLGVVLQNSIGEKAIIENEEMKAYGKGTGIQLKEENVYVIAGHETELSDCFEARNSDGEMVPLYFEEAWNSNWEIVDVRTSIDRTRVCISKAGVYWLQIYAVDKNKSQHSWMVKVLVNER